MMGRSYTLHVGFASADPELVATIANLYAEEYLANQVRPEIQGHQAGQCLAQQCGLVELRKRLEASDPGDRGLSPARQAGFSKTRGRPSPRSSLRGDQQPAGAGPPRAHAEAEFAVCRTAQSLAQNGGDDIEAYADVLSSTVVGNLRDKQARGAAQAGPIWIAATHREVPGSQERADRSGGTAIPHSAPRPARVVKKLKGEAGKRARQARRK